MESGHYFLLVGKFIFLNLPLPGINNFTYNVYQCLTRNVVPDVVMVPDEDLV